MSEGRSGAGARGRRGNPKQNLKEIARERIEILFRHADSIFSESKTAAHAAVKRARAIGMKFRVHIPQEFSRKYCKKCNAYLKSGVNCTVRLNQKKQPHIVITCKECGAVRRIPYKK